MLASQCQGHGFYIKFSVKYLLEFASQLDCVHVDQHVHVQRMDHLHVQCRVKLERKAPPPFS